MNGNNRLTTLLKQFLKNLQFSHRLLVAYSAITQDFNFINDKIMIYKVIEIIIIYKQQ